MGNTVMRCVGIPSEFEAEGDMPLIQPTPAYGGSTINPDNVPLSKYGVKLVRRLSWLVAAIVVLFAWALAAPAVVLSSGHDKEGYTDGYDGSALLALVPMGMQAVWSLAFCIRCRSLRCSYKVLTNLRMTHHFSLAIVTASLASRVVALKTFCRLQGHVELSSTHTDAHTPDPFAGCTRALITSDAVVAVLYAAITVVIVQVVTQLEMHLRRQLLVAYKDAVVNGGGYGRARINGDGGLVDGGLFEGLTVPGVGMVRVASPAFASEEDGKDSAAYDVLYGNMRWLVGGEGAKSPAASR